MSIGNRMRGLGESVYYLDDLKPKMDELMGDVSYELNHEVGKRKLLVRLDGFGEEYKPQIETLMDEELPVGYRMEYDPFPLDYIRVEFLEGAGYNSTYIDTGIIKTDAFNASLTWSQNTNRRATGWGYTYQQDSISYSSHVQISNNSAKFGDYMVYCYRGYTIYPFPPYEGYTPLDKHTMVCNTGRKEMTIDGVTYKTGYSGANRDISNPQKRSIYLFGVNGWLVEPFLKIYSYSTWDDGKEKDIDFIPAIDSAGIPCMFDLVTKQPFYNQGTGQFIAGLTMKQALNLAKLPTPSGNNKLTISLPKEATLVQHNQEVEAALNMAAEKGWNIPVQYRAAGEEKEIYNKYAECKTADDVLAVNADYKNDLTDEGEWIYPLENLENTTNLFKDSNIRSVEIEFPKASISNNTFYGSKKLEHARVYFPNITTTYFRGLFEQCTALKTFYLNAPNAKCVIALLPYTNIEECTPDNLYAPLATDFSFFAHMSYKIKRVTFDFSNATNLDWAFSNGTLVEFTSELPNLSTAADGFKGKLNKESALRILNSIPAYTSGTHKMSIHIHVDHQSDEEVINAISKAEAKGWTMTVAWKGTPTVQTASTFGLRKPPIYAKLGTVELPDGTVEEYLDWGHYVTNWEKNGYQEFASIEEAEEHFNIKKEIME